jgi:adenosylhomocysteine nucleosidase
MAESTTHKTNTVVIISANGEWKAVRAFFPACELQGSPFGEYFSVCLDDSRVPERIVIFRGGWGKIAAAASAQYAIDRWAPRLLVNLGTCGGIKDRIERGTIILAEKTLVHDIVELMGDQQASIQHYTTDIDLSWLEMPYPCPVMRAVLVSSDHDLLPAEIRGLVDNHGAIAADWESGAIAWVAKRNNTRCLILRGVSDVVSEEGGEAYGGNAHVWQEGTNEVMATLLSDLTAWMVHVANAEQ